MSQGITKEFLKAFFDKYTYNPFINLSARWAMVWCGLLLGLGIIHMIFWDSVRVTVTIDCIYGVIAALLYATLGVTGTLHQRREETIKSYSKNLEQLVAQKTELLRKSEAKYRMLFELVPAGMFRVTDNLELVDVNRYALNLIGLPCQEVIGKRCRDIICKKEPGDHPCQGTYGKEIEITTPSGEKKFVVISCRSLEMEGKSTIIGSINNISERKKLENAILEHKLRLESIFDGMDDGIIAIDNEFKIAAVNRKQAGIMGLHPEELAGRPCKEVLHPTCEEISRKVFQTGEKARREIMLCDRDGREICEDIIYAPIKNKEGAVVQVIEVLRDITEKKQMESLLIRSERLASMGEIAASVAHEINNPLGIIAGFTQRLLDRIPKDTLNYEELKIIDQECIRCAKIIKDLLDFARPGIPHKQLLDIAEIIVNSLKLIEFQTNKNSIRMQRHI
ncbi:MAG: PAS domain S-box protein, partial [bacterium]